MSAVLLKAVSVVMSATIGLLLIQSIELRNRPRPAQIFETLGHVDETTVSMRTNAYFPNEIYMVLGRPTILTLVNEDGVAHDMLVPNRKRPLHFFLLAKETIQTSLFFSDAGEFIFYCSQLGHQESGMRGSIHVIPADDKE